jgi:hypothetical protein
LGKLGKKEKRGGEVLPFPQHAAASQRQQHKLLHMITTCDKTQN